MPQERQDLGTEIPVYICYTLDKGFEGDPDEYEYVSVLMDEEAAKKWVDETNESKFSRSVYSGAHYEKSILIVPDGVYIYKWRDSEWAAK